MNTEKTNINGVNLSIVKKPLFEMIGYKKAIKFGDGSIDLFIKQLIDNGNVKRLTETLKSPQQIWLCLSDCQSCGLGCSDFEACSRVCIEKTEYHDFSNFVENELSTFSIEESEWVLYETNDGERTDYLLEEADVYKLVNNIGYKWNEKIRLHFDNGFECSNKNGWILGKTYYFLLPVVPM